VSVFDELERKLNLMSYIKELVPSAIAICYWDSGGSRIWRSERKLSGLSSWSFLGGGGGSIFAWVGILFLNNAVQ